MNDPERGRRVDELCDAALNREPRERSAFVAAACDGDETLRQEVEALLAHAQSAEGFLAMPMGAVAAHVLGDVPGTSLVGRHIGGYQVVSPLGTGGMGEVYRARDPKLGRDVAIKVLPRLVTRDPERLSRFEREARMLAALNHPHIGAIYGLEDADGVRALVLELVEGQTLAERLARAEGLRPLPPHQALEYARQIAEALEAAHEKGIVHRDLKPANVMITPDGVVKVLDFGLAKAAASDGSSPDLSQSPTVTIDGTQEGTILGTGAYMSPEQARGQTVDKRTDIWAFGCVLYEMLTGRAAFGGETISDTIAAILGREPEWKALPETTPAGIRRLLQRCLQKDPKRRLRDVADARLEIDEELALPAIDSNLPNPAKPANLVVRRVLPWAVAGALGVGLALMLVLWAPWRKVPPALAAPITPLRLSAELGADASLVTDQGTAAILSPDGAVLAFVARRTSGGSSQLYIRRLEQLQATALAGTDEARSPFFSPDGQWIAFFAGSKLKKISVTGGDAVTLCDAPNGGLGGGVWADDGTIVFSPDPVRMTSLWRVSSAGGRPELLTTGVEGETVHRWPQVLPGGKAVLYTSQAGRFGSGNVVVQPLPDGPPKILLRNGYFYARYLPSGHLVYMHGGTLVAAPFDLNRLELVGQPVAALEGVAANSAMGAQIAVAANGTLVYLPGRGVSDEMPIAWMDRAGKTTPLRITPANWANPFFAPDGRRLAMDIFDGEQVDVWIYDWARATLARLTLDTSDDREPVWTPDGQRIAFGSTRDAKSAFNLYWQRADGTGEVQRLTVSKNSQYPASWHPSGKFLVFVESSPRTSNDLMILPMEGDEASGWKPGKPFVFLNSAFAETYPMFSPDGRWLSYVSDESGQNEVYVRPFPGPGGKWQISTGGGQGTVVQTMWSRARPELFYTTPDKRIMVASYTVEGDVFRVDKPRLWSEAHFVSRPRQASIDLHPDGERFALAAVPETQTAAKQDNLVFIFNFFDELRRLAPTAKK